MMSHATLMWNAAHVAYKSAAARAVQPIALVESFIADTASEREVQDLCRTCPAEERLARESMTK
jgi:hypothetical protein